MPVITRRAPVGRRRRRGSRGNALTLAVVILLAMIALGLLAVRSTRQNIAGSGNLRMNKQARYIAEMALHQTMTFMNQQGALVLQPRMGFRNSSIELDSSGRVAIIGQDGAELFTTNVPVPPFLTEGPNALGQFGEGSGLVPSYRVTVDGFRPGPAAPGNSAPEGGSLFCQMEFTARGYVADEPLPNAAEFDTERGLEVYAEATLRAGSVLRVDKAAFCQF